MSGLLGFGINLFNGVNLTADGCTVNLNQILWQSNPFDNAVPMVLYVDWNATGVVNLYVNGVDIGMIPDQGSITTNGWLCAAVDRGGATGVVTVLFAQSDSGGSRIMGSTNNAFYMTGGLRRIAVGRTITPDALTREKIIGKFAWYSNLQDSLPDDFRYKDGPPQMYSEIVGNP